MNQHDAHSSNAPRQNPRAGPSRRPATISELAERANVQWDESRGFKYHLKLAEKHRREGKEYARAGDMENAFVELAKAATLVLERLPEHSDYNAKLNATQRQNLALNGQEILDNLAELKPGLVDRYERWRRDHPDGIEEDTTPNARTQQLANEDAAARARAQRELQIREEEAARAIRQLKDQERMAEEATRWVQQRQLLEAQEEAQRQEMASAAARKAATAPKVLPQPPDLTFSRPNSQTPGHGSQNTVVLMERQGRNSVEVARNHQQEEMRQREEEITRRQEQKRRQEQDGIARRQHESEEAARAARQNLTAPSVPYPVTNMSSTSTIPPPPPFPTHLGPLSSSVPKSMFYPTTFQYPTLGPTAMPLESPYYEGDSTDSESLHHDFRRLSRTRLDSDGQKSPLKPVRVNTYPPPITTTSPIPGGGPIRYPSLMTQHQKTQGYYPSLGSMFADSANRQHGFSLLFTGNTTDARAANSTFPWASNPVNHQPHGQAPYPYANQRGPQPPNATTAYMRPPPPPPPTSTNETFPQSQSQSQTETNRILQASDPNLTKPLKTVSLPRECLPRFLAIAKVNTEMNKETCGLLLGKDKGHKYSVTTMLIPKQTSTSDTCTMLEEELVLQFTEERSLITLGWIHTHPSQSCFMSSVDLHTHSGFQRMLPESFAVVCAPKFNPNFGIFRITDPPGLDVILNCEAKEAFHPHPDLAIYTDADKGHVQMKDIALEIVDLR